jgi:hypothetical protein
MIFTRRRCALKLFYSNVCDLSCYGACYRSASRDSNEDRTFGGCDMKQSPTDVPSPVKNDRRPFIWLQLCSVAFPFDASPRYSGTKSDIPKAVLEVTKEDVRLNELDCTNLVIIKDCAIKDAPVVTRCALKEQCA